jgi:hypothetical protein
MNLALAKAAFLEEQAERLHPGVAVASLELLYTYFSNLSLKELGPAKLRQFLSVWYLEEAVRRSASAVHTDNFPDAQTLLACLMEFFSWLAKAGTDNTNSVDYSATAMPETGDETMAQEWLAVLQSLQETLPRAIAITGSLTDALANQGGAFAFPEFLTSFEEGGQSAYDIGDVSGEASAIEGYFQILGVDGPRVEAQELVSERMVSPILFPEETAALLDVDYLVNLELVLLQGKWQIVNCGFAYPPGADVP